MLRLIENWEITRGEGASLRAPEGMNQDTFLKAIQGPETLHDEVRDNQMTGQTNVDVFKDAIEGVSYFETTDELETATMPQLRQMAKAKGVSQKPSMKAEELKARIRAKDTT